MPFCKLCGDTYLHTPHEGACPDCWKKYQSVISTENRHLLPRPFRECLNALNFEVWTQMKHLEASFAPDTPDNVINEKVATWAVQKVAEYQVCVKNYLEANAHFQQQKTAIETSRHYD